MTITIRNVQIARDTWNDDDPTIRAWKEMASYRIHREAVVKAGQRKSPALPLSLLTAVHKAGMRIDQIAQGTGVTAATVSLAMKRNGLTDKIERRGRVVLRQCVGETPVTLAVRIVSVDSVATMKRTALPRGVPAEERARLRHEFYAVSERLRTLGLTFEHIAALSGRTVQSVHQWRIRKKGYYPTPPQEVIDDLLRAAERHEGILARAQALLETLA